MSRFLCTYGPRPSITCSACRKSTVMVPAWGTKVRATDVARYRRTHVCGTPGSGWDVEDRADAGERVR